MSTRNSINSNIPISVSKGGLGVATLTDHGILLGSGTGAITPLGSATNGQLCIGSTSSDPVLATITAGANITITNNPGSISIAASGGSLGVAFYATLSTPATDVTGDGGLYFIIFNSERFDLGSDYNNTTGIFTAPSTGKYMFSGSVGINNQSGATTVNVVVFTDEPSTGKEVFSFGPTSVINAVGIANFSWSYIADLTASDTARVYVIASNGSGNIDEVSNSSFSGYLIG